MSSKFDLDNVVDGGRRDDQLLAIYEQSVVNYGLHVRRCERRVDQAVYDFEEAEAHFNIMLKKLEVYRAQRNLVV